VDDANRLSGLRRSLEENRGRDFYQPLIVQDAAPSIPTVLDRLRAADAKVAKPDTIATFVSNFFDSLITKVSTSEFADYFALELTEHARFEESHCRKAYHSGDVE